MIAIAILVIDYSNDYKAIDYSPTWTSRAIETIEL